MAEEECILKGDMAEMWELGKSCLPSLGHSVAHVVIYQYFNLRLEIASAVSSQLPPPPIHKAPPLTVQEMCCC